MSALGELLGGTHVFTHNGADYEVSPITQKVKLDFERRLFGRAKEAALALRECMDKEEYSQHLKKLNDDYIAGEYAFESNRGMEAIKTISGMVLLSSLLFGVDEATMLRLVSERKEEVASLITVVIKESFPGSAKPQDAVLTVEPDGAKKKRRTSERD